MVGGSNKSPEDILLQMMQKNELVSQEDIHKAAPNIHGEQIAIAINSLLSSGKIEIVGDYDDPRYRARSKEDVAKLKGLGVEDLLVYQVISQSGNTGIWTRDMKTRTNLAQAKITKILKSLEERCLVKAVKSVQNASRKVFMLASLEPAKEITGGPWYGADQQPDKAFIETIRNVACGFVQKKGPVTVTQVAEFIAESGVSNQDLQEEDVANIMRTLCYDLALDKLEMSTGGGQNDNEEESIEMFVTSKQPLPEQTPLTSIPCGVCPVFHECRDGGPVSPSTCLYYTDWLSGGGGGTDGDSGDIEDGVDVDMNAHEQKVSVADMF